jgi:hypothetical protein
VPFLCRCFHIGQPSVDHLHEHKTWTLTNTCLVPSFRLKKFRVDSPVGFKALQGTPVTRTPHETAQRCGQTMRRYASMNQQPNLAIYLTFSPTAALQVAPQIPAALQHNCRQSRARRDIPDASIQPPTVVSALNARLITRIALQPLVALIRRGSGPSWSLRARHAFPAPTPGAWGREACVDVCTNYSYFCL